MSFCQYVSEVEVLLYVSRIEDISLCFLFIRMCLEKTLNSDRTYLEIPATVFFILTENINILLSYNSCIFLGADVINR